MKIEEAKRIQEAITTIIRSLEDEKEVERVVDQGYGFKIAMDTGRHEDNEFICDISETEVRILLNRRYEEAKGYLETKGIQI